MSDKFKQPFEDYVGQYIEIRFGANEWRGGLLRAVDEEWLTIEPGESMRYMSDKDPTFLSSGDNIKIHRNVVWMYEHHAVV